MGDIGFFGFKLFRCGTLKTDDIFAVGVCSVMSASHIDLEVERAEAQAQAWADVDSLSFFTNSGHDSRKP